MSLPKLIVVLGTTACGKSGLGVELAKRFDGEIVSADSRQVYKGLDLGTGKVTEEAQLTEVTPEMEQAAYDAAIAERTQGVTVLERLESDSCTVLYTSAAGGSGGEFRSLTLVYKPGTAKGAGEVVNVGLPSITDTIQAVPEDMALSDDGKTLTFTCTVDERSAGQQVGAYHYAITLETGEIRVEVADR